MKLIFAVLDVSLTMGLTRCYKAEGFLHLYCNNNGSKTTSAYSDVLLSAIGRLLCRSSTSEQSTC